MNRHLLCLTLDTDPDGATARVPARPNGRFRGLEEAQALPERLDALGAQLGRPTPLTWFVRVDSQIEALLGCPTGLLTRFAQFWKACAGRGDELAWHPHLFCRADSSSPVRRVSAAEASDELERLWEMVRQTSLQPDCFRNGEAWHTPETFATIERLGFRCDSTVIPGRQGGGTCVADWTTAPNHPYFPASYDLCRQGNERPMLEVPMNGWWTQASYDLCPRIRYMNPAIHEAVFVAALRSWRDHFREGTQTLNVWTLVLHPDEFMPHTEADALYCHSLDTCCRNLVHLANCLTELGHTFEFVTMADAANRWRLEQRAYCFTNPLKQNKQDASLASGQSL